MHAIKKTAILLALAASVETSFAQSGNPSNVTLTKPDTTMSAARGMAAWQWAQSVLPGAQGGAGYTGSQVATWVGDFTTGSNGWQSLWAGYAFADEEARGIYSGYGTVSSKITDPVLCQQSVNPTRCTNPETAVALQFKASESINLFALAYNKIPMRLPANTDFVVAGVRVTVAVKSGSNGNKQSDNPFFKMRFGASTQRPGYAPFWEKYTVNVPVGINSANSGNLRNTTPPSGALNNGAAFVDQTLIFDAKPVSGRAIPSFRPDAQGNAWFWVSALPESRGDLEFYIKDIAYVVADKASYLKNQAAWVGISSGAMRSPF